MGTKTDVELRPFGFIRGDTPGVWCADCGRTKTMDAKSFKCRPCAERQAEHIDRELIVTGRG